MYQPDIQTDLTGKASFSFYTSDKPATYTAVIEGITEKGDIIYEIREIKVGVEDKESLTSKFVASNFGILCLSLF